MKTVSITPPIYRHQGDIVVSQGKDYDFIDPLIVEGNLYINNSNIKKLPKNLYVKGDMDISDTDIKELPKRLIIDGNFWFENTKITKLPKGLKVKKNLYFDFKLGISKLPENLYVGGTFYVILDEYDIFNTLVFPKNYRINTISLPIRLDTNISNADIGKIKYVITDIKKMKLENYLKEKDNYADIGTY